MHKKLLNKDLDALVGCHSYHIYIHIYIDCIVLYCSHDSCCDDMGIGVVSKTHSVVVALKRQASKLASYQQKVFKIDDHMGIAISGLTSDARVLGMLHPYHHIYSGQLAAQFHFIDG